MIYAQAGTTVEAFLIGAPEGLIPGLEWALVDPTDGSYDIPRSGGSLSNPIPDIYRVTFTAPAVPDTYLVRWYSGVTVLADEELVVTSGPPDPPLVVGDDLVVRADLDARQIKYVDAAQADAAIADASAHVRDCVSPVFDFVHRGGSPDVPASVVSIVCQMVRRVLTNPTGLTMETLGDYTYQANVNTATLMPTAREKRALRRAAALFATEYSIAFPAWGSGSVPMQADLPPGYYGEDVGL